MKAYIKQIRYFLIFSCASMIIMSIILALYRVPGETIGYGMLIIGVLYLLVLAAGGAVFSWKRKQLRAFLNSVDEVEEGLPEAANPIEEQYQEMIAILQQKCREQENQSAKKLKNMKEYYTMWAHQIKTPISAMSLMFQQEEEIDVRPYQEQLFKIEQYVEMVLQYIRSESLGADLELKYYSLDDLVRGALRKCSRLFMAKKLRVDYQGVDCKVLTDEKWLSFVIEQILSNAIKYTEQQRQRQEAEIRIYMEPGKNKVLVIEDCGIGIRQEDLPRIFENGFTGFNGRTDKKSTGIGLYLCKKILDQLSHNIWVESEVGKGTKVYLDLQEGERRE